MYCAMEDRHLLIPAKSLKVHITWKIVSYVKLIFISNHVKGDLRNNGVFIFFFISLNLANSFDIGFEGKS